MEEKDENCRAWDWKLCDLVGARNFLRKNEVYLCTM